MLFTPIYIAMTFIKTWRIRSFRARLLEFLSGNTSVAFCKVPENAAETPTLSSKLCTNPRNAHLCDLLDYTNATRICSMKPTQSIELHDWVSCAGGLPLGSGRPAQDSGEGESVDTAVDLLLECEMERTEQGQDYNIVTLESMGELVAWKAGTHLAIVLRTNIESLSLVGFNFVGGEFIVDHHLPVVRIQTVVLTGEPNKAIDASMRSLRSEIQHSLKSPSTQFQWPIHAALLRKLSKVVDIKSETKNHVPVMNGTSTNLEHNNISKKTISTTDVSVNTMETSSMDNIVTAVESKKVILDEPQAAPQQSMSPPKEESKLVVSNENVTVEIKHNITPKKSSLKLDLKKGTSHISASLLNISSQIKSVTTHKRIVSSTGPRKSQPDIEVVGNDKVDGRKGSQCELSKSNKSLKISRPLVNTKSPNVLIYSDSVAARDNLEASLKKVLDGERYTVYSVTRETLEAGAWRGRTALVAVGGDVAGRAHGLLLAHLLDGGRLLALCSSLLHTVLPYYKTAEVRENEVVQFTYDKWESVRMKHHIFCYQASPAKKQFSTENDRQPPKYTGHPGHELDIQVLASEETWRTPSLLQATDLTNGGIAIFSQVHLEADPTEYLGVEGVHSNTARLEILRKIMGDVLGLHVTEGSQLSPVQYTKGYFLGNHVQKMALVEQLCGSDGGANGSKLGSLTVQWCERGQLPRAPPDAGFLPVCVHDCPDNFSTVEYFENLTSSSLGRLVVYSDVLASTQDALCGARLAHGLAVVARRQAAGRGRGTNAWLSAVGCAMLSLQVWTGMSASTALIQHAAAVAAVRAIRTLPAYEQLDIRIKWPNDIYYGRETKIGGVITNAECLGDEVIVNIGTGVNISNLTPTTCVNEIIRKHNAARGASLPLLTCERFLARYCSQLERILQYMDTDGGKDAFMEQYYQYWLHDEEVVQVLQVDDEKPVTGVVSGLDESGFLRVRTSKGELRVQPDGNTFDMMAGLIAPRH